MTGVFPKNKKCPVAKTLLQIEKQYQKKQAKRKRGQVPNCELIRKNV